jgi:hypothetical protein
MILVAVLSVNQFINAQNKSLWKDVEDFSKSSRKMVKEGVKIIKEDPNSTANRLMNDEKYQKKLNSTVEEHSQATEWLNKRVEDAHYKVIKSTSIFIKKQKG